MTRTALLALCALVPLVRLAPLAAGDAPVIGAVLDPARAIAYPPAGNVIVDVTKPPYSAKGDGVADDTDALQRALADHMGQHRIIWLPKGTYLVSKTLKWSKKNSKGGEAWGFNFVQGEGAGRSVIRLKDATFTDAAKAQTIMWCGGFGSADWFHNYIEDVGFDVGKGNPGAIGLQFYSNNSGAVRRVRITSGDGAGAIGLDLGHRDMNGPLLVRDLEVVGFATGIRCGAAVNSQTFERITLRNQTVNGFVNGGQCVAMRGLLYEGEATAVRLTSGLLALLDSRCTGRGAAAQKPAVVGKGRALLVRDLTTTGYQSALTVEGGAPVPAGAVITEYLAAAPTSPFPSPAASLRLPVRETPDLPWDPLDKWAVVDDFGADPKGGGDSSDAIQKAIDSGATTVFLPGCYSLAKPIELRGAVRRLIGAGNWINYGKRQPLCIRVADGTAPVVSLEHLQHIGGGIEIATARTVVIRSAESKHITCVGPGEAGELFLEDICTDALVIPRGKSVWARQLNIENQGNHLSNRGALWVLGYKTERGGTLLETVDGGQSEVFGTFSYTTTAGGLAPMFITRDAAVFALFGEICFTGDPFKTLITETRGGETRTITRGAGGTTPYSGWLKK